MNAGRRSILKPVRTRLAVAHLSSVLMTSVAACAVALLALVLADAGLDLSDAIRQAAPLLVLLAGLLLLVPGLVRLRRIREESVAAMLEKQDPSIGTRLTNAVQLGSSDGATPVEDYLRSEVARLGRECVSKTRVWPLARRPVLGAGAVLLAAGIAWLALVGFGGGMLSVVWPRFTDPRGDHPPFSLLKLAVEPEGVEVIYGGSVEIRARAGGRPVEKLWMVLRDATNEIRSVMFLAPDRSFFQTLSNVREPAEYFVTDGHARTKRFKLRIRSTPQIQRVEFAAEFPAYTGLPARLFEHDGRDQTVPVGTRLTLRVFSNRPLREGTCVLTPALGGTPVRLQLVPSDNPNAVTNSFTLGEARHFSVGVTDITGLESIEPRKGRLNVKADTRPRLFVREPGRDAVATPEFIVPVRVQAEDDYGVARVVWLRGHNRSVEQPFNMKLTLKNGAKSVEAAGAFDLGVLGVRPGDVIEYYFEAADNDPLGPNLALSRLYKLEIISTNQFQEILRNTAARQALFEPYFKLGAWLRRLAEKADRLSEKASATADPSGLAPDAKALAADLQKYLSKLAELMQMPELFDVESGFRKEMKGQEQSLRDALARLQNSAGGSGLGGALKQAADALKNATRREQEQVDKPAAEIASVARLLAQQDVFVKLAQEQAANARFLQRFAQKNGALTRTEEMEVRELIERQRKLQEALREMVNTLPKMLDDLPAGETYEGLKDQVRSFLTDVANAGIDDDLTSALKSLDALDVLTGYAGAQSAATKMDALVGRCKGAPGEGQRCLKFNPSISESLGDSLAQILAAMGAGNNGEGRYGYSMFARDVGMYGEAAGLAGEQGEGRGEESSRPSTRPERLTAEPGEIGADGNREGSRVRLQPDAPFPLRYRDLVGEYFRAIAESQPDGEK